MKIIDVKTKEELNLLYSNSALTMEGLAKESIQAFVDWVQENSSNKVEEVYTTSGKVMNEQYNLTTTENRYKDDITIVSMILKDLSTITLKRFEIGARWFDDIVDNNARREDSLEEEEQDFDDEDIDEEEIDEDDLDRED